MIEEKQLTRWALVFRDPEAEAAFERHHIEHHGSIVRTSLRISIVLVLVFFGMQSIFAPELYLTVKMISSVTAIVVGLVVASLHVTKVMKMHADLPVIFVLFVGGILFSTREFPLERRMLTYGFFLACVAVNAALPYGWRPKILTNLATIVAFLTLSDVDGIFTPQALRQISIQFVAVAIISSFLGYVLERMIKLQVLWKALAQKERAKSDELLKTILPDAIAERLIQGERAIVDNHPAVTVIFADVVGFTKLAATRSAAETAGILNDVFQRFDVVARQSGVEKVKTIGDAYMAVAGAPLSRSDHAELAANMALEMREALVRYRAMSGFDLEIRIGMHSGAVAAGIIGKTRFLYDFWGDTVNMASRMESTGLSGQIQVSATTAALLKDSYEMTPRQGVAIKGKGTLDTFILVRPVIRKPAA